MQPCQILKFHSLCPFLFFIFFYRKTQAVKPPHITPTPSSFCPLELPLIQGFYIWTCFCILLFIGTSKQYLAFCMLNTVHIYQVISLQLDVFHLIYVEDLFLLTAGSSTPLIFVLPIEVYDKNIYQIYLFIPIQLPHFQFHLVVNDSVLVTATWDSPGRSENCCWLA